jgi:aminopeptidase N
MANGVLRSHKSEGGWTTWRWRERDPMSTYLATATLGRFDLTEYEIDGIPAYVAVDPQLPEAQVFTKLPEVIRFFSSVYGPYPFTAVGAVADSAPAIWWALETQTKPVFPHVPDEATFVHELAHMWFGDSVTLGDWPDIWLNEGFATWSDWIWSEGQGRRTAHEWFQYYYSLRWGASWLWTPPPGDPGRPEDLFCGAVYARGAMTLQALREMVGDDVFFDMMRTWAQEHRYGTVTTPEFIALAEQKSGMELDAFFQTWLYEPGRPTAW